MAGPANGMARSRRFWASDAAGAGYIWLTALAVSISLAAVCTLLLLLLTRGLAHFWPATVWEMQWGSGADAQTLLGTWVRSEQVPAVQLREGGLELGPGPARRERVLVHLGLGRDGAANYVWVLREQLTALRAPAEITVVERRTGGRLYGYREVVGPGLRLRQVDASLVIVPDEDVIRAFEPNALGIPGKLRLYAVQLWEFLATGPRNVNTAGGVFPALFGTVLMVLLMSVVVTPFGVLAAIYLSEYARQGFVTRLIRIAVNNLAGVPSIIYGVFGLGFFIYLVGGSIDTWLFADKLPAPTFGTPGLLWASLTLALLTLPVVIVATEEGLARIPRALREGSLALGATRAETLWRVVLPMASPAMLTGVILAIARAAGEVAPLMLVGVVKLAPALPVGPDFPWVQFDQKFMHLGFHIFDVAFHSPDVEGARSLVYATALLLVTMVAVLNFTAVALRNRLREKYRTLGA